MIIRSKDLKDLNKKKENLFSEQKADPLSVLNKTQTEDLDKTPPIAPPAAPLINHAQQMTDRFNSREPSRKKQTEPLTKDDDFLKYLFVELRKTKSYFRDIQDKDDLTPVRAFIRKCWLIGSEGEVRFAEIQDYLASYEKHKDSQQRRSQQPAPQVAPLELVVTAPPEHIRARFGKAS